MLFAAGKCRPTGIGQALELCGGRFSALLPLHTCILPAAALPSLCPAPFLCHSLRGVRALSCHWAGGKQLSQCAEHSHPTVSHKRGHAEGCKACGDLVFPVQCPTIMNLTRMMPLTEKSVLKSAWLQKGCQSHTDGSSATLVSATYNQKSWLQNASLFTLGKLISCSKQCSDFHLMSTQENLFYIVLKLDIKLFFHLL